MIANEALAPDWVMVGISDGQGGVVLLASQHLTRAELEYRAKMDEIIADYVLRPRIRGGEYDLRMTTDRFVLITAPDYPTAFARLFEQWAPAAAQREPLAGARAIEAGE